MSMITPSGKVPMGGTAVVASGMKLAAEVAVTRCADCIVMVVVDSKALPSRGMAEPDAVLTFDLGVERPGWVRAEVRDSSGRLVLVGNAIHFVPTNQGARADKG